MATINQHIQAPVGAASAETTRAAAGRRPTDGGSADHRAGLAPARQGLVRGPQPRHHAGGGSPDPAASSTSPSDGGCTSRPRPDSWKARHVAASGRVAVTVPVRRGGLLSLVTPIPPATIGFHANAIVHPADSPEVRSVLKELASLRRPSGSRACIIEVIPEGFFVTYGVGVSLIPSGPGSRCCACQ